MNASDVMTRHVISVSPDASVEGAAKQMLERGISGLVVVDAKGDLAGVVTEGDLLRRDELGTERNRPWWLRLLVSPGRQALDFTRTHGRRVRDVMTERVVTVAADATLEEVVELMEQHRIKRVPVTEGNRVVGVVSRADLLRALVVSSRNDAPVATDDRSVRRAVLDAVDKQSWTPMTTLNVTVADGVVDLWGTITNEDERRAISVLAENTPGVKRVNDHLVFVEPYSGTVITGPADKE
ncbi:MAG TPA: CBS domain-containing protein [Acetobacteraceae bacterium]|jgi:CBS-domain-containing membrane protein